MKEIKQIIKNHSLKCSVKEFEQSEDLQDRVNWYRISEYQKLSGKFIEKFQDKVRWYSISRNQKLSEKFIEKFQDEVAWSCISKWQKLSEPFIEKFQDKVEWYYISISQKLSEKFIEKFQDKVFWDYISRNQKLSEKFIEKFQDIVVWDLISKYQKLSEKFIEKFQDKVNVEVQRESHKTKSYEEKLKEIKAYAEEHGLKFDGEFLYAFREHDMHGRGMWNRTISYKKGEYYQDWRCDMNASNGASFGLGIWPEGNTTVKVKVSDWGVNVSREDGKGRVIGFEVLR